MRSLVIALLLFALLLGVIAFNFFYVRHATDRLRAYGLQFAKEGASRAQLDMLHAQWQHWRTYLSFSVNFRELDRMEELIISLTLYHEEGNTVEFRRTALLIVNSAANIARLEQFDFENIC